MEANDRHIVRLSAGNWIGIAGAIAGQVIALIGLYIHMDRRLTTVETTMHVLAVERPKITDSLDKRMEAVASSMEKRLDVLQQDVRILDHKIDLLNAKRGAP